MSKSEILPCPFCGDKELVELYVNALEDYCSCWVFCDKCEAQGSSKHNKELAIESWNIVSEKVHQKTVLPEYLPSQYGLYNDHLTYSVYREGYNKAIDELKRLNPNIKFSVKS